ncbi:hypothetical protein ACGFNU_36070 [Spirillospora sp. NPDC048911]|uniref:hypothetical protein n=1 Tax=Spirillospora sp. NPDC048911 TaxID=3364527 RepID=UPI003715879B
MRSSTAYRTSSPTFIPDRNISESHEAALAFIRTAVRAAVDGRAGTVASRVAFDPSFAATFASSETREQLRRRLGVDLGYDAGDDLAAAICGLPLLPGDADDLVGEFARMAGAGRAGWRFRVFRAWNGFPADTSCTAVAGHALYERNLISPDGLMGIARELLLTAVPAGPRPGVVAVYWDDDAPPGALRRGRTHDPVACANALCVLMETRRLGLRDADEAIEAGLRYVGGHLLSRDYLRGSRYHPAPEAFLYAVSRLVKRFPSCREPLAEPLAEAILARDDDRGNALNVALRTLAAHNTGLFGGRPERLRKLLDTQEPDGSWPALPYFKLGRFPVYFGSRVLSTLFAAAAIRVTATDGTGHDHS